MSADYEYPVMSMMDAEGGELKVVRHFRDGIFLLDPAKIVVYDAKGRVIAETSYCRDVITHLSGADSVRVHGIDMFSDLLNRTWEFNGESFFEARPLFGRLLAVVASLRQRWWGYGVAVCLSLYGLSAFLDEAKAEGTVFFIPGFRAWLGLVTFFGVFCYTPLSLLVVLVATAGLSFVLLEGTPETMRGTLAYCSVGVAWLVYVNVVVLSIHIAERRKAKSTVAPPEIPQNH